MNILRKVVKFAAASGLAISTFFVFNFYLVFNKAPLNDIKCVSFLKSKKVEICYNFVISDNDFCPIGTELSDYG